jgi:hypothetical protein
MVPTSSDRMMPMISSTRLHKNLSRRAILLYGLQEAKVTIRLRLWAQSPANSH